MKQSDFKLLLVTWIIQFLAISVSAEITDTTKDLRNQNNIYQINEVDLKVADLNNYLLIYENLNPEKTLDPKSIPAELKFNSNKIGDLQCSTCNYLGKLSIHNNTSVNLHNWILRIGIATDVEIYILEKNGNLISQQHSGRLTGIDLKNFKHGSRFSRASLDFSPGQQLDIYIHFKNRNGFTPRLDLKLSPLDYNDLKEYRQENIWNGLFIGFLLSLIILNLIFYITTKDKAFFFQFTFVLSVLLFMLDVMDISCDYPILNQYPLIIEPLNFCFIGLMNISYMYFIVHFVQLEKLFPGWILIIKKLVTANLGLVLVMVIFYGITKNERISDGIFSLFTAIQYLILFRLLFGLYKSKDRKSYFIILATLFLIAGVIVIGIWDTLGNGVPLNFAKFIVIGNVSFFFLGLAYRMKLLNEEEVETIRLKENQELKNRLYANITHEFRTPLTVIQGMAQQIESGSATADTLKFKQAIQLIKSNGNRLLQLVNTILDLTKLESGKMQLNLTNEDIITYLRYLVQSFESYADSKKLYLQFLTEQAELKMQFDKEKIRQIITNLISNAIKFTPQGGKIQFMVKKSQDHTGEKLVIEVKDNGIGIKQDELHHVFDRFFQVEGSKIASQGSGLGLTLVKELVELMHGSIEVASEFNKGSSFKIYLPVLISIGDSSKTQEVLDKINDEADFHSTEKLQRIPENSISERSRQVFENDKPILLLVDDNKDIIYYLQSLLESQYNIETAFNGNDGIALAQEIIPDLIISDVMMPDKNGYELCQTLKSDLRTSHIPIILLTAKSDLSSKIEGIKQGADAYLVKPFDELELQVQLENVLRIRKKLQDHFGTKQIIEDGVTVEATKEDEFIIRLKALIETNLEDEDFGILQLCRGMQMSRTQLHRKITALTGKSTSIYLRSLRLQKAKELLNKPEMNIAEVAFAVGFSDPNYFSRTFTEEFGITPSKFRGH